MYPSTEAEFALLALKGRAVEYAETASREERPAGDGWEYWSDRITPDEHVAVWRRVAQLS